MSRTTIETLSGRWLDFTNPQPEQIDLGDIATALSNVCRFGGQTPFFYSVSEHACLVRDLVREDGYSELGLAALHHDSHEAFLGDLPTPLKSALEGAGIYRPMVTAIDQAIGAKLNLDPDLFHHPAIVRADRLALRWEASVIKPSRGIEGAWEWRELPEIPEHWAPGLAPEQARERFLRAHASEPRHIEAGEPVAA